MRCNTRLGLTAHVWSMTIWRPYRFRLLHAGSRRVVCAVKLKIIVEDVLRANREEEKHVFIFTE